MERGTLRDKAEAAQSHGVLGTHVTLLWTEKIRP